MSFFGQDVERDQELVEEVAQEWRKALAPGGPDVAQLVGQRAGGCQGRLAEQVDQRAWIVGECRLALERLLESRSNLGRRRGSRPERSEVDQLAEWQDRRIVGQHAEEE